MRGEPLEGSAVRPQKKEDTILIFFAGRDGSVLRIFPTAVRQGSADSNSVYLIAPFAQGDQVTVSFRLADGREIGPAAMTPLREVEGVVDEKTGAVFAGWSYVLPATVVVRAGKVTVQFYFYSAEKGCVTASEAVEFSVARGISGELPETPSEDVYGEILANIASVYADVTGGCFASRAIYAWNEDFVYGINEICYLPNAGSRGAFVRSKTDGNKQPPYVDGALNSAYWDTSVSFDEIYAAEVSAGQSAAQASAHAEKASGSAESAAQSQETAARSAANAALAEQNAKTFAERAEAATSVLEGLYTKEEVDALAGGSVSAEIDSATFIMKIALHAIDGSKLSETSVDLPLESVVVGGRYADGQKALVLALQNGNEIQVPIGDVISGLVSQSAFQGLLDGSTAVGRAEEASKADKVAFPLKISIDGNVTDYTGEEEVEITINTTSATDTNAVHFTQQTLTSAQQEQARANIGAQIAGEYQPAGDYATNSALSQGLAGKAEPTGNYPDMIVGQASFAESAGKATSDGNGANISDTYARKDGTYSEMSVGSASSAETAVRDGDGNEISAAYLRQDALLNKTYPVGAIYMSLQATSPASLFGGTWTPISDKFLYGTGSYAAGSSGGEAAHVLSVNEMPSHNHAMPVIEAGMGKGSYNYVQYDGWNVNNPNRLYSDAAGGGQAHNNMPPFYAVYMWRRTA